MGTSSDSTAATTTQSFSTTTIGDIGLTGDAAVRVAEALSATTMASTNAAALLGAQGLQFSANTASLLGRTFQPRSDSPPSITTSVPAPARAISESPAPVPWVPIGIAAAVAFVLLGSQA